MDETMGLREIKKQMTRESIATAALKLTLERGISDVTIEEIARDAFVSPRTVSNYFASKEEAVVAAGTAGTEQIVDDYGASSSNKPPLKALCEIWSDYARQHPEQLRRTAQLTALEEENPTLRPFRAAQEADMMEALSHHIAARTGTDPEQDLYPTLVASAAISAMMTALDVWFRNDQPDEQLPELIQEAFNIASDGYAHELVPAPEPDNA